MPKRIIQPTKSAIMLKEYLDVIMSKSKKRQIVTRYDIYRRAGNESQTDKMIKFLTDKGLIIEEKNGFLLTKLGEDLRNTMEKRELLTILTRDLTGSRLRHR